MRLDQYLVKEGFFTSREKARTAIEKGLITLDIQPALKPATKVLPASNIKVKRIKSYVSRAGTKLEQAMRHFQINPEHYLCLDVGSSTGGFTQYLLENGASKVFAVDVGTNQMAEELAKHPKVELFENTDIRNFELPSGLTFDLIVIDVSFISLRKIIPTIKKLLQTNTRLLMLFKPQFEVGKEFLKKGIVKHPNVEEVLAEFISFLETNSLQSNETYKVPLKGKEGNQEFFIFSSPL